MGKRFEALQSCKGIAALFIVCGHFLAFTGRFTLAYVLMCDFFFVCSGMTTGISIKNYEKRNEKKSYLQHVFIAKIKKIWLPYIIVCVIWIGIMYLRKSGEEISLLYIMQIGLLLQCMGFMSNGEAILNVSPIGISWYLSVDFWIGSIYFNIIYLLNKKEKNLAILLEIITAIICWNVLVNTSPNYMDVHYAKCIVGNITMTYAMIRALLGYSIGLLIAELYIHVMTLYERSKGIKTKVFFTVIELLLFGMIYRLYGNVSYNRANEFVFPLISAMLVLVMCMEQGYVCAILKTKIFHFMGKYSLYFYLTHLVAREIVVNVFAEKVIYLPIYIILVIILSLILNACCTYINKIIKKASE